MTTSRFKIFNRVQDQGGSRRTTTVIPPWRDFEDWPPRFNVETGAERRF
jgi:hypothetical protein